MTTERDQREPVVEAANRTRASVGDGRFAPLADEALATYGPELRAHLGRADVGELFTPLEVWIGRWERGAAVVVQDRAVLAWGDGKSQIIPRKRPGGVTEIDIQPDAITLWIDCDQPLNVRVQRFEPGMDVPTTFADMLRPDARAIAPTAELPPAEAQCPHCFATVREGAEFCPACGRHIGPKPPRSKKPLILLLLLALLLLILGGVAIALLSGDEEEPAPRPTPTATSAPTEEPTAEPTADPTRRISGPGWEGRAPREGWRISGVERQSGGRLLVRTLRGPDGAVIRIFHTPEEKANPGTFRTGELKPLETAAEESNLATVRNFGTPECQGRNCSDLLLNDPAWGGLAITVNATRGERLEIATAIAQSIKGR